MFFKHLPDPWSTSLYEYAVKNIFIHLDDSNPDIQKAIRQVLLLAARVQTQKFLELAEDQLHKCQHASLVKSLVEEVHKTYK